MDERLDRDGPVDGTTLDSRVLLGIAAAIPAGATHGAIVGAGCGFLVGLFPYLIGWIITAPLYALAGALLGSFSAAIVGAVGAASRSIELGGLAGGGVGGAVGLALLAWIWLAPATPPPFGPGRPINPAATAEEEEKLERDYLRWTTEQDQGARGGLTLFLAVPITLCVLAAAWAAARRLACRHLEWAGESRRSGPTEPLCGRCDKAIPRP